MAAKTALSTSLTSERGPHSQWRTSSIQDRPFRKSPGCGAWGSLVFASFWVGW